MFSILLRPLVKLWRSKGLKAVMYLDNGICAVKGKIEAKKASAWVRDALECAGLVVHEVSQFGSHHLAQRGWDLMQTWNVAVFWFQKLSWQCCVPCCRSLG